MLKTALKPQWIAGLLLALVVSGVFVGLGKWQMDNAASAPPPLTQTETPVALTEHFQPEKAMFGTEADQIVTMTGQYLPRTDVFVSPRLQDDREGYWVVTAFRVDGAPNGEVIPVVRGWTEDPAANDPVPEGRLHITGRLLPAEGPRPEGLELTEHGYVLANLASAELINLWDVRSYAGYVAAFDVVATGGAAGGATSEDNAADAAVPADPADPAASDAGPADVANGEEVGAQAPGGELEPVWVGPQPQETTYNWMNIFYAIEWVVFAGFALYLWWRFLRDDVNREREEEELDRQWAEEWRVRELARRRAEAREAKRRATEEYERYHGLAAARSSVSSSAASAASTSASSSTTSPSPQENQ